MKTNRLSLFAVLAAAILADAARIPVPAFAQTTDPVLVGAGDIANCNSAQDDATAKLLDSIGGTVFTLGDNTYPDGTAAQFTGCYGPSWGRHKARTRPAPGNHDYHVSGAAGYFGYFGAAASPQENNCTSNCKGYYSYNLGAWHILVINSEIDFKPGSAQDQWLRADLTANRTACTLAYWHEPLYSSGLHGNVGRVRPLWEALYQYGADVILNAHDHDYERFAPQNPNGQADPRGIREFVVGTGGGKLYAVSSRQPNSEAQNSATWGVLKLTLHAASYDWEFVPIAGQTFRDSGSANCVNPGSGGGPIPGPTATSGPPSSDLIFSDSFENSSLSGWTYNLPDGGDLSVKASTSGKPSLGSRQLNALIDDGNLIFVLDGSPNAEPRYRARFYFDPNSISMQTGDSLFIFMGYKTAAGSMFRLEFGRSAGGYQLRLWAISDTTSWSLSPWIPLSDALHSLEILWRVSTAPGANNGVYTLWVDGVPQVQLIGLDNDTRRIDEVRMGVLAAVPVGTRGTFFMDAFESRRITYIGPLP